MKDNEPKRGKWRHSLKTVLVAGTGMCVHIFLRLNPIASLAWLGKQLPCPLHSELLVTEAEPLDTGGDTHTHRLQGGVNGCELAWVKTLPTMGRSPNRLQRGINKASSLQI